ncbi:hypothetical protein MASR2M47_01830 [Draconibacterium sp.]
MKDLKCYISENDMLSVRKQCELLDLSRSSIYYQAVGESEENLRIMRLMDEEFLEHPTHGSFKCKIFYLWQGSGKPQTGAPVAPENGHYGDIPKTEFKQIEDAKYVSTYLLRGLKVTRPNQVW